ncbi:TPA: SDR family NAD(P)-dependent oxidoreductase [Corynebacterium striatum]
MRAVIDVNALGVTLGTRAAYPYLKKTPGSQLINIASIAGCYGIPDVGVYAATKAYVQSMTETLDLEWRRDKIRVLDINPPMGKDTHLRRKVQNRHTPRRKPHARRRRASHLACRQPQEPLGQRPPPLGRRRPRQSSPRSPQHDARPRSQAHLPGALNLVIETIRNGISDFVDNRLIH